MFSRKTTVDHWQEILSIIEEYSVDYLVKVFDKLTKFHQNRFSLNDAIYARYGDQRSSQSRFFNQNEELFGKLIKTRISFNAKGGDGDFFYYPKKWIPFCLFLKVMKYEILEQGWSIERYKTILNDLKKSHFDNISIDYNNRAYPYSYELVLPYLFSNDKGVMAIRKIYSDVKIYVKEENPLIPYALPNNYSNMKWKYLLNEKYIREAFWYAIVEIEDTIPKKISARLYSRSLAIDTSKIPSREEIESMDFNPTKVYKMKVEK